MTDTILVKNNSTSTLTSGITSSDTVLAVVSDTPFVSTAHAGQVQFLTLVEDDKLEIVKLTSKSNNNSITVVRGQQGTVAQSFGSGSVIEGRATEDLFNSLAQGFDNYGEITGENAINLQTSRNSSGQRARGDNSIAIGSSSTAYNDYNIAIGDGAYSLSGTNLVLGKSTTSNGIYGIAIGPYNNSGSGLGSIAIGNYVVTDSRNTSSSWSNGNSSTPVIKVSTDSLAVRLINGLTGAFGVTGSTEPIWTDVNGSILDDGTARQMQVTTVNDADNIAIGSGTHNVGESNTAIGHDAQAFGIDNIAVGTEAQAFNKRSVAIGHEARALGEDEIVIGGKSIAFRNASSTIHNNSITLGDRYSSTSNTFKVGAIPAVSFFLPSILFGTSATTATTAGSSFDVVLTSTPVSLGTGPTWSANTSYKNGDVVFPPVANGYCYVASTLTGGDWSIEGISNFTEPTWATTVGDLTIDNEVNWECVDAVLFDFVLDDYKRFIPTEVGFICERQSDSYPSTYPSIAFGIPLDAAKYLSGTVASTLIGPYARFSTTSFNSTQGAKIIRASLTSAGAGNIVGRYYMKGIVLETSDA